MRTPLPGRHIVRQTHVRIMPNNILNFLCYLPISELGELVMRMQSELVTGSPIIRYA